MDDRFSKLEEKIDKIIDFHSDIRVDIAEIRKDISQNTRDLQENKEDIATHIKRTDLLEQRIDLLEEPNIVKKYIYKIIISLGAMGSAAYAVVKIFQQ